MVVCSFYPITGDEVVYLDGQVPRKQKRPLRVLYSAEGIQTQGALETRHKKAAEDR
jgi:hypothetical protein